jgi:DnaD/phage-associated family protein
MKKNEQAPDYIKDALEMSGSGYETAVEIESPRTVIQRRNGRNHEIERAAFVKISTAFKPEMKDIDEIALKVWLYIALSVNRNSGKAHPGLRTIAEECKFAVNTVRAAIDRLENKYFLLTVHRNEKTYNIYEPVEFVSVKKETVSADDTDNTQTVSAKRETVSPRMILNQSNQKNNNQNAAAVFSHYQNNIAMLVPSSRDEIGELLDTYNADWIIEAIDIAVKANKRNLRYIRGILKKWGENGKQDDRPTKTQPEPVYQDEPDPLEGKRMSASEYKAWKAAKDAKGN